MKLINLLVESMIDGSAFKSFTDAVVANAPSNISEIELTESEDNDICKLMSIVNQDIDPDESDINIDNSDINEIIQLIEDRVNSEEFEPDMVKKIEKELIEMKNEMEKLSSDNDVINTNLRQIQNLICK